jgi:hypothetical protein
MDNSKSEEDVKKSQPCAFTAGRNKKWCNESGKQSDNSTKH